MSFVQDNIYIENYNINLKKKIVVGSDKLGFRHSIWT